MYNQINQRLAGLAYDKSLPSAAQFHRPHDRARSCAERPGGWGVRERDDGDGDET